MTHLRRYHRFSPGDGVYDVGTVEVDDVISADGYYWIVCHVSQGGSIEAERVDEHIARLLGTHYAAERVRLGWSVVRHLPDAVGSGKSVATFWDDPTGGPTAAKDRALDYAARMNADA